MENTFQGGNRPQQGFPPGEHGPANPMSARYKFTPEERRVLKECNRESFWYRSVPIGTALSAGVYAAVKNGFLSPSLKWGAAPKMFAAAVVGYFMGKVSYQRTCAEKLMQLPDSEIGEYLRKAKASKGGLGFQETLQLENSEYAPSAFAQLGGPATDAEAGNSGSRASDISDTRAMNSYDNESSQFFSNIDIGKPVDDQPLIEDNLPPLRPQHFTTYDDLRRENRIEYERRSIPPSYSPTEHRRPTAPAPVAPRDANVPRKSKNMYGDVWEEVEK